MKSLKIVVFLVFFPILIYSQSGPKMEVTGGETINAGNFPHGKEVHLEIKFKNIGDEDLKINSVSTSCGCSTALATNDTVKPGDEGAINFTFNGNGYGQVAKNIMINTNETPNNMHTLLVQINMMEPLTLDPSSIITSGKVGDELTQTAKLQNSLDKDVSINEISANTPVIKVTTDKTTLGAGESALLSISIKIYEDSPVNAAVLIKTSEGDYQYRY